MDILLYILPSVWFILTYIALMLVGINLLMGPDAAFFFEHFAPYWNDKQKAMMFYVAWLFWPIGLPLIVFSFVRHHYPRKQYLAAMWNYSFRRYRFNTPLLLFTVAFGVFATMPTYLSFLDYPNFMMGIVKWFS